MSTFCKNDMSPGVNFEIPDLVHFDEILLQHDYHRYRQFNMKNRSNFLVYNIIITLQSTIFKMYNKV